MPSNPFAALALGDIRGSATAAIPARQIPADRPRGDTATASLCGASTTPVRPLHAHSRQPRGSLRCGLQAPNAEVDTPDRSLTGLEPINTRRVRGICTRR